MFPRSKKSLSAILLLTSLLATEAGATQVVENADRGHVQVNISVNETNRLAIDGRRIANVVPSVKGVLAGQKDEALGAYYFTLASESPNQGTVTVFVSDEKGVTYKLILVPRPVAGEEIIIRPPSEKATPSSRAAADGRTVSYQRRIKDLMLVMADDELKDSVETIAVNKEVPLWKEGRLILVAKYMDGDVVGEKYRLTNVSPSEMLLVEQELYRRGVRAIAVEHHTLMQGDGTDIYIVRERKDNE
ncbi:type-F conjugative transfer system secretin TraK [Comamonas thiooxydans]|uniref:type-F conjugative transfer system secretin TraK n=1 Tax=Burkholderiales TaxID=80840 RepID=UPI0007BCC7A2|nr:MULTISPECIES: type-F conjugative transfer system secretin TraK [Burkholderiales]ANC47603.1 conjugal transfer protein TraK [Pandoraea pnomenusa]MDH1789715.1 type-F conjugative transfer system secretin TraK [Comamonas thiooxydans]